MSGRRIAFLFLYAFASMTLPVLVPLALRGARGQLSIERASSLWSAFAYAAYGLIQIFLFFPVIGSWAAAVEPQTRVRVSSQELKQTLLSLSDERLPFAFLRDSDNEGFLVLIFDFENRLDLKSREIQSQEVASAKHSAQPHMI